MVSPDEMKKAMNSIAKREKFKSRMYDPRYSDYARGLMSSQRRYSMRLFRRITEKAWLLNTVVGHIIDKTMPYMRPLSEKGKRGFAIELKDVEAKATATDKKKAKEIEAFILATNSPKISGDKAISKGHEDNLVMYTKKILRDVLTLDQTASEKLWTKGGELIAFEAIDAATIVRCTEEGYEGDDDIRFVQTIDDQVVAQYSHDQMLFQYQNPRTDILHYGYGYCLPGWTKVLTEYGYMDLKDVIDAQDIKIWDGDAFREATRIVSGKKSVKRTYFTDGTYIDTSKDHFFKVLDETGKIDWKSQKELTEGSWVLSSNVQHIGFDSKLSIGEDMAEMLGWLYSDGTWSIRSNGYPYWRFFYSQKDKSVIDRHEAYLRSHFTNVQRKKTKGGLSVKGETLWITKSNEIKKYQEMGFDKGVITPIFNASRADQIAFLRGVFSANGYVTTHYHPGFSVVNGDFIRNINLLLDQIGIKSVIYKAKYENKVFWKGKLRENNLPFTLVVQDVKRFKKEIGFLHDYKNEKLNKWKENTQRMLSDIIPIEHARLLLKDIERKPFKLQYGNSAVHTLTKIQNGSENRNKTFAWMKRYGVEIDYHLKKVDRVESLDYKVEMYDLSIIDGNSQFIADGVWVHNSKIAQCVDLIVSLINSFNFNAGAFVEDKLPRGMLLLNGDVGFEEVEEIEDYLIDVMSPGGVSGAVSKWGIPIIPSGKSGDKTSITWQALGSSNQDMQFSRWQDTLYMSIGSIYGIDIESMGIKSEKGAKLIESGSLEARKYSDDKGIGNALMFLSQHFQDYVDNIDPRFKIVFHGFEQDDAKETRDAVKSELETHKSLNEIRKENDESPVKFKFADVPGLQNDSYRQAWLAETGMDQPDQGEDQGFDDEFGDEFEKSIDDVVRITV